MTAPGPAGRTPVPADHTDDDPTDDDPTDDDPTDDDPTGDGHGTDAEALVLRDLLDCAVQEGLVDPTPGDASNGCRVTVPVGHGHLAWRARDGGPLQPTRYDGGTAWNLPAAGAPVPVTAARALELVAGHHPHAREVAADLRTAVEHAAVTRRGRARLPVDAVTPRPGDPAAALLAGERLAATRNRPFHPTARAAVGWSADDLDRWGPTRASPLAVGWVLVRRDHVRLGPSPASAALHELVIGDADVPDGHQLLPVHPGDHARVLPRAFAEEIADGTVVPLTGRAGALHPTASLRTLAIADARRPVRHLKLPLGVATLGATRLLPPRYLDNADRARRVLDAVLDADPELAARVALCDEGVWAGFTDGDDEFATRPGRLAAQIRTYPDLGALPVPLAALAAHEWEVLGPVLDVDGADDARRFLAALATSVVGVAVGFLAHGVLPEMHGQNVVCCLGPGEARLVLRDHDTVRVHPGWSDLGAGIGDPAYRIAPGAAQSLVLDRPEELVAYLQTLVVQVALRGVLDAVARRFGVDERRWWPIIAGVLEDTVAGVGEPVRGVLRRTLFDAPDWPARSVLGPLLARGASGGVSMPAGTVRVPNPLWPSAT